MKAYLSVTCPATPSSPMTSARMISPSYSGTTLPSKPRAAGRLWISRTKSAMCLPAGAGIPSSWRTLRLKLTDSVPSLDRRMHVVPDGAALPASRRSEPLAGTGAGAAGACATTVTPPSTRSVLKVLKTDTVRTPESGSNPCSEAPSLV